MSDTMLECSPHINCVVEREKKMHAIKAFAFSYFVSIYVCLCVYGTMKRRRMRE